MRNVKHLFAFLVTVSSLVVVTHCRQLFVQLSNNGPVVSGANITLKAKVYTEDGDLASGSFRYFWNDDALKWHRWYEESTSPESEWTISYPSPKYYPSVYKVEVRVENQYMWPFNWVRTSSRTEFNVTDLLNGELHIHQNTSTIENEEFVSNKLPAIHSVDLKKTDLDFLTTNATQVTIYWFIDCHYYGLSSDYTFNYTFKESGKSHDISALVVASLGPTTTTTTTTTTTIPIHTPNSTVTTVSPSNRSPSGAVISTTPLPPILANSTASAGDISNSGNNTPPGNHSVIPDLPAFLTPDMCLNSSVIPREDNKTYGLFQKKVQVKAPVENLAYVGTNWIQPGNILHLQVSCNGSGEFHYCYYVETEDYNVTGKESCLVSPRTDNCSFVVEHMPQGNMTMIIIVSNAVSKGVLGVKVNLYNVQKHAQISVVILPVTCSLIVVVVIVFGVAYYVQSRAKFTIEIADFDFGQTDDLVYKTFGERLRDAVNSAVHRGEVLDEENTSPSSGQKYGSLH